ncbi:PQQ-binding-like beta-propeller repeat protein [Frigoribacterium sp. SL97]|uniref:outer membrane protein assembly factor BamB family protein n=1 Tax=Frigoribacterium sp. SL97 TaxID=2994664 RepID=UPI00226FE49E|nr:PQQ-binding-like beta-propeller repeat protein [Frigoribacterium sp. SL97]WAC50945.1 PQQ-binding-like beta-propeller repeat protein [Frigoribacterium sp. SL97]
MTADGERLWSSDRDVRGGYSVTRSCLAVTDVRAQTVTCLDLATGDVRWTDPASSSSAVDGLPGQTDDRVFATATAAGPGPVVVRALDGSSGSAGARLSLPDGAVLAAAGRTVGYALAYGTSGGRSTLVAFDLSSGRALWEHAAELQVYAWAGRLVDVDVEGVARVLVSPERLAVPTVSSGG